MGCRLTKLILGPAKALRFSDPYCCNCALLLASWRTLDPGIKYIIAHGFTFVRTDRNVQATYPKTPCVLRPRVQVVCTKAVCTKPSVQGRVCTKAAVIDNELYRSPSIQLSLTGFVQLHFVQLSCTGFVQIPAWASLWQFTRSRTALRRTASLCCASISPD